MAVPAILFFTALAVRAIAAASFPDPAYPDPLYYVNVARQLADGNGLMADYIWGFVEVGGRLPAEGLLPVASNAHWMPLASLVQVPFIWLLGPSNVASSLPFWLIGAAVAPVTWWVGLDAGLARWQAAGAAILVAFPGALALYMAQPDNFALFMLAGCLALWLCARGVKGDRRAFALGGVMVGIAFLSRTDGILLGIPFAMAYVADALRHRDARRIGGRAAVLCVAGAAVLALPWLLRQLDTFGSLSPSATGGRILWATEHDEIFSLTAVASLERLLDQGVGALLVGRAGALTSAIVIFVVVPLLGILAPFMVVGLARRWRTADFWPWATYAAALLAASALLFAVFVTHGFFLHSMTALVPHAYLLAMVGVEVVIAWVAARRPGWETSRASPVIASLLVIAVAAGSIVAGGVTLRAWSSERAQREPILAGLARVATPGDRVMSPDPGAYRYHGGWQGVITPNDPLVTVEETLRRYDVRWLAVEGDHLVPSLKSVLLGHEHPDWLSEPIVRVASSDASGEPLRGALYAVCLRSEDERCQS